MTVDLLVLPNNTKDGFVRKLILEYVLSEPGNFILVQNVKDQMAALRFTRSKPSADMTRPARRMQHPEILYTCRQLHREGWQAA